MRKCNLQWFSLSLVYQQPLFSESVELPVYWILHITQPATLRVYRANAASPTVYWVQHHTLSAQYIRIHYELSGSKFTVWWITQHPMSTELNNVDDRLNVPASTVYWLLHHLLSTGNMNIECQLEVPLPQQFTGDRSTSYCLIVLTLHCLVKKLTTK